MLSERRPADRAKMVSQVVELATRIGATALVCDDDWRKKSDYRVEISTPRGLLLGLDFRSQSLQPDVFVLSWHIKYRCDEKIAASFSSSINTCHFQKATHVVYGFDRLLQVLERKLAAAINGSAFQLNAAVAL